MLAYHVLITTSIIILAIGLYGILTKRNLLRIIMSLEIAFQAGNINIITFAYHFVNFDIIGRASIIILIATEACILSVMIAVMIGIFRTYKTIDVSKLRKLRW